MKHDPEYRLAMEIEASARRHSVELTLAHGEAAKRVTASHDTWMMERLWRYGALLAQHYPNGPFIASPINPGDGEPMGEKFFVGPVNGEAIAGSWTRNDGTPSSGWWMDDPYEQLSFAWRDVPAYGPGQWIHL